MRRIEDARYPDALFPVWTYYPFFTGTDEPAGLRLRNSGQSHHRAKAATWMSCPNWASIEFSTGSSRYTTRTRSSQLALSNAQYECATLSTATAECCRANAGLLPLHLQGQMQSDTRA